MLHLRNFQSFTVVLLTACGGDVAGNGTQPTVSSAGGQSTTDDPGAPGAGASATNGGSGNELAGGIECITDDQWNQITSVACAGTVSEVDPSPFLLEFVVDVSGTMGDPVPNTGTRSKWEATRDALSTVIGSLPGPTATGLLIYPNKQTIPNNGQIWQPVDTCIDTSAAVSPQLLGATGSAQRAAIANALSLATARGGTPTEDAFAYALNSHVLPMMATYGYYESIIVLITDGDPTIAAGCEGVGSTVSPTDTGPVIQAIAEAWANYSVKTVVIGLPVSESSSVVVSDPRTWMSLAASAGQGSLAGACSDSGIPAYCHIDLMDVTDLQSGLVSGVRSILSSQGPLVPCAFKIPPPPDGRVLDPSQFAVAFNQTALGSTAPTRCLVGQSNPDCAQGDGWYFDPDTSLVTLCAKTCEAVQKDPAANLTVLAACIRQQPIE